MASTTPTSNPPRQRSTSHTGRHHPTTPLRPPSRTSLRASSTTPSTSSTNPLPLESLEPGFAEFSDSMADLEANMMHLQLLHESIARFNENFASFLYGLNMSAFCVDFPEAPGVDNFRRARETARHEDVMSHYNGGGGGGTMGGGGHATGRREDVDATFLTTDTSFVENPPASTKPGSRYSMAPTPSVGPFKTPTSSRVGAASGRGRGIPSRGARGGPAASTRGSGVARGRARAP